MEPSARAAKLSFFSAVTAGITAAGCAAGAFSCAVSAIRKVLVWRMLLRRRTNAVIGCKVHSSGLTAGFFCSLLAVRLSGHKERAGAQPLWFRQRRAYSAFRAPEKGGALPPVFSAVV